MPPRNRNTNGDKNDNKLAEVLKAKIREFDTLLEQMRAQAKNKKCESYPVVLSDPLEIRKKGKETLLITKRLKAAKDMSRKKPNRKSAFKTTLSHASNT